VAAVVAEATAVVVAEATAAVVAEATAAVVAEATAAVVAEAIAAVAAVERDPAGEIDDSSATAFKSEKLTIKFSTRSFLKGGFFIVPSTSRAFQNTSLPLPIER
jgi:hypothetical protein